MPKRKNSEAADFEALKELGFEFKSPQDEFSYQPDSGGSPNGKVAEQETGAKIDLDAIKPDIGSSAHPAVDLEWNTRADLGDDEKREASANLTDDKLQALINDRIARHPRLKESPITVSVDGGRVNVSGEVMSDAARLTVRDVIESLPGVKEINNDLHISA